MSDGRRIAILGPFPPPVHGAAKNTRLISEQLTQAGASVIELRSNPEALRVKSSTIKHYARKIFRALSICIRMISLRKSGEYVLYTVPDGGLGLYLNIIQYLIARMCGSDIILHHRNYSHIYTRSPAMKIIKSRVCPDACHVFLSPSMSADFQSVYGAVREKMLVPNAAMLDFDPIDGIPPNEAGTITVGHLSNLTQEKGFDVVAEVMRRLSGLSEKYRFILAGAPVNELEQARLEQLQADLGERLEYKGPIYGEDKVRFFAECDVFLFPTRYPKEAQPNVLYEALAGGCIVLSTRRACIPDLLAPYEATVFDENDFLSDLIVTSIENTLEDGDIHEKRVKNLSAISNEIIDARQKFESLMKRITDERHC